MKAKTKTRTISLVLIVVAISATIITLRNAIEDGARKEQNAGAPDATETDKTGWATRRQAVRKVADRVTLAVWEMMLERAQGEAAKKAMAWSSLKKSKEAWEAKTNQTATTPEGKVL